MLLKIFCSQKIFGLNGYLRNPTQHWYIFSQRSAKYFLTIDILLMIKHKTPYTFIV